MRTRKAQPLIAILVMMQVALAVPHGEASPAAGGAGRRQRCSRSWQIVPSPNSSAFDDQTLVAVSASGKDDAWAVGFFGSGGAGFIGTLTLHWDGAQWAVVESPNPTAFFNALFGVVAIAPDDAWAVGSSARSPAHFRERPLAMHWDGMSWTVVPPVRPHGTVAGLSGVDATRTGRVSAVGYVARESSVDNRALVESWTGRRWQIVSIPTPRSGVTRLAAIEVLGPRKAWAVGVQGRINEGKTLAERWNGRRWTAVRSPSVGTGVSELQAISARRPTDAWSVGSRQAGLDRFRGLAEHFDGRAWRVVPTARVAGSAFLRGVAARTRHEVWAVGAREAPGVGTRPLVERWDGSRWAAVPVPRPRGSLADGFSGIGADPAGSMWAVGSYQEPARGLYRTLIERLCR